FFFSRRRRHTRFSRDWSSDVCSSDLNRDHSQELWGNKSGSQSSGHIDCVVIWVVFRRSCGFWNPCCYRCSINVSPWISDTLCGRSEERRVGKEGGCGGSGCEGTEYVE